MFGGWWLVVGGWCLVSRKKKEDVTFASRMASTMTGQSTTPNGRSRGLSLPVSAAGVPLAAQCRRSTTNRPPQERRGLPEARTGTSLRADSGSSRGLLDILLRSQQAFECDDVIRRERMSAESTRAAGYRTERPLMGCFVPLKASPHTF